MNSCGSCNACCEVLGFTGEWKMYDRYNEAESFGVEFGYYEDCNKLCTKTKKCTIWHDKPRICNEFNCYYITEELDDKYRPDRCQYVAYENQEKDQLWLVSRDRTLPPEIQYNNNKQLVHDLIEEVEISVGLKRPVWFCTKQGNIRIK